MFLLLSLLDICISFVKSRDSFLHKDIKQLASSLTAVINRASISSRAMSSVSLYFSYNFASHVCYFSNRSELNLHISTLGPFSHEIYFDINLWKTSFFLRVPLPMCSAMNYCILNLRGEWEYQQTSLTFLQAWWNFEVFTEMPTQYVSKGWISLNVTSKIIRKLFTVFTHFELGAVWI